MRSSLPDRVVPPLWLASLVLCLFALPSLPAESEGGWVSLFDGRTTQGWHHFQHPGQPVSGWAVDDGWLHCLAKGGGDILSDAEFADFELEWEWKLEPGGNSGVKYFVLETRKAALGHEYQLLDDERHEDARLGQGKRVTAAFYDVLKPDVKAPIRPMGEINQSRVLVKAGHVEHWLNGVRVLVYECGSERVRKAVAESKFRDTPGFGNCVRGHFLLQDHHSQVWFRNVRVRDLSKP
jgi:hypothetical protein